MFRMRERCGGNAFLMREIECAKGLTTSQKIRQRGTPVTLNIQTEQDEQRQLLMTIEVPEERIEKQMRQTARRLSRDAAIPGFRKGKVPYPVLLKRLGREALRGEAIEDMLQGVFEEALKEVDPDIYAQASFEDMELEPLVLKFTIPLTPEVDLGTYRDLRKEIEPVEVKDEAVEEALEAARMRHQVVEEVERAVEAGDLATFAGKGELVLVDEGEEEEEGDEDAEDTAVDDTIIFDTERTELLMDSEKLFPGTPFVENIVGMNIGDEKEFEFTFPEDFEDEELAGKDAIFNITILGVKSRQLPELNDELAIEEGHDSLEAMRESTYTNLLESAEQQAQNDLIEDTITMILEDADAKLVYPPAAVDAEIHNRIDSFKQQVTQSGWEWEDYLKLQGGSEESLHDDFREGAEEAVQRQLVIRQFVFDEKLRITDEDIDAQLDKQLADFGDNEELNKSMRDFYKQGYGLEMISSQILMDKVYERMAAILSGAAPDLAELEAEEAEVEEAEVVESEAEEVAEEVEDTVEEEVETAVTETSEQE